MRLSILRQRTPRTWAVAAVFGLVAAVLGLTAYGTGALNRVEAELVDARYKLRPTPEPREDVLLVQIDDRTVQETGFPLSRSLHAALVDRLAQGGAKVIAYDVPFSEPATPSRVGEVASGRLAAQRDAALLNAISRSERVVLSAGELDRGRPAVVGGIERLRASGSDAGLDLYSGAPDGVVRRLQDEVAGTPHFARLVATKVLGRAPGGPSEGFLEFAGPPGTYPAVSAVEVLTGQVAAARLRGKVVVVGEATTRARGERLTPLSTTPMTPAELAATAIATQLEEKPLRDAPAWVAVLLVLVLSALPAAVTYPLEASGRAGRGLGSMLLAVVGLLIAAQLLFDVGIVVTLAAPLLALVIALIGAVGPAVVEERTRRRELQAVFSRFVPAEVVDDVVARAEGVALGGVSRQSTVLFCDLRGFTAFAEELPPATVIEVLNEYLREMSDAILDRGGTLVSFMGDGIMAVFGAPLEVEDHADRALNAAREMLEVRLPRFNAWLLERGLRAPGDPFRIGIGLNSGEVMSGTVGSERRVEYTAIGDTTNTAARVETACKACGRQLLLTDATLAALLGPAPDVEPVSDTPLPGRASSSLVYGLVSDQPSGVDDARGTAAAPG